MCNQVEVQLFRRQITCVQAVRQCSGPRLPVFRLWYHFECVSIVSNPHLLLRFCTEEIFFRNIYFTELWNFRKFPFAPDLATFRWACFQSPLSSQGITCLEKFFLPKTPACPSLTVTTQDIPLGLFWQS